MLDKKSIKMLRQLKLLLDIDGSQYYRDRISTKERWGELCKGSAVRIERHVEDLIEELNTHWEYTQDIKELQKTLLRFIKSKQ